MSTSVREPLRRIIPATLVDIAKVFPVTFSLSLLGLMGLRLFGIQSAHGSDVVLVAVPLSLVFFSLRIARIFWPPMPEAQFRKFLTEIKRYPKSLAVPMFTLTALFSGVLLGLATLIYIGIGVSDIDVRAARDLFGISGALCFVALCMSVRSGSLTFVSALARFLMCMMVIPEFVRHSLYVCAQHLLRHHDSPEKA